MPKEWKIAQPDTFICPVVQTKRLKGGIDGSRDHMQT